LKSCKSPPPRSYIRDISRNLKLGKSKRTANWRKIAKIKDIKRSTKTLMLQTDIQQLEREAIRYETLQKVRRSLESSEKADELYFNAILAKLEIYKQNH